MVTPQSFRVRMYNVGFGDCFLLSFYYDAPTVSTLDPTNARTERHVLIDFGSTSGPRSRLSAKRVAELVSADSGERLDAIVISHRHKDHLSAFGTQATAKVLSRTNPLLVVRSWTENPRLPANSGQGGEASLAEASTSDERYLGRLRAGEELAERIVRRAQALGQGRRTSLVQLAAGETRNASAVSELERLSAKGRGEYVYAGRRTRLNGVAPGVSFRVIGPPKPRQWPAVTRQAAQSEEFWLTATGQIGRLFSEAPADTAVELGTTRWIIDRLRRDERRQVANLVRWLDDALNNTSVVLLIEVGEHRLLFGGDAQIENWGWALDRAGKEPELERALAAVTLYKVGHHGSRNATPKSLYRRWENRPADRPLISMMSTKSNVHGSGETAVPRSTLVEALKACGQVLSTDVGDSDWVEVRAALPSGAFEAAQAPTRLPTEA